MKKNQKIGFSIAGILIVLIIIYAAVTAVNNKDLVSVDSFGNDKNSDSVLEEDEFSDDLINIDNQAPGRFVYLKQVNLSVDGWISVYEMKDDKPLHVLGAQFLEAGKHTDVVLILQAPTMADGSYAAVLHSDDGKIVESKFGIHDFDLKTDKQLEDSTGNWIMKEFKTIVSGSRGI